ncbi:uncharacterized protein [Typha angustifolia]|uniref:uncharacterized protein isoform X2 n=1 Tax=Typha angustifolia TaxID=59011 RepID=UPI003C2F67EF
MHPLDTTGLKYNHQLCHFHYQCQNITNWALGTVQRFYPAILGQFSSNGLRTGAFEASKLVLVIVAPALSEIQWENSVSTSLHLVRVSITAQCMKVKVKQKKLDLGESRNFDTLPSVSGVLKP